MKGVIAAGSQEAARAGIFALKRGGNAFDAAVAAQLTAFVSEPLLTGFGGAGIAAIKTQGTHQLIDMFTSMPGLGKPAMSTKTDEVSIDFGPTVQKFSVGPASVAVPAMPQGLAHIHRHYCVLPMDVLIQPALQTVEEGVCVSAGFHRVLELLKPIFTRSDTMTSWFTKNNRVLEPGERFFCPQMSADIHHFAQTKERFYNEGVLAQSIDEQFRDTGLLSKQDLTTYNVATRDLKRLSIDAQYTLYLPSEPSVGGRKMEAILRSIRSFPSDALGFESIYTLFKAHEMAGREAENWVSDVISDLDRSSTGHTTHLSVVDETGNAIGITSSLGESAGMVFSGTGVIANNFLGEADVAPKIATQRIGKRLVTMCSPSILVNNQNGDVVVMGSGGSSRIVTAVLHGILYLTKYGYGIDMAVKGPRQHLQDGLFHLECDFREESEILKARQQYGDKLREFNGLNMYFGGLHMAGIWKKRLVGAGDTRRSGVSMVYR